MRKSFNKFKTTTKSWEKNPSYKDGFPTGPLDEGKVKDLISVKALSKLPKGSYSVKADPYTGALPTSTPYNILAPFLKSIGGHYEGDDNIDGGNLQQYANSTTSKLLAAVDTLRMKIKFNYRMLPIKKREDGVGDRLIDEMRKSISEAVSVLMGTTFTNLAITKFGVVTDMNMGSATGATVKDRPNVKAYTDTTDVMYAMSIYYQIVLQEILSVMNAHNAFRKKQGTAIRNGWNREVPALNAFFGLMNKKAFLSLLNSINLSFEGEYIDKEFMVQTNMITTIPSRRANALLDPVLELEGRFDHPETFEVYLLNDDGSINLNGPVFKNTDLDSGNTITLPTGETVVDFWKTCEYLKDYLTLENTTKWARQNYTETAFESANARYNAINSLFNNLVYAFVHFKPKWADFRECYDIMTRTGTISWVKGYIPEVTKDTDGELFQNLIVDDIYKLVAAGNDKMSYNDYTKRWTSFSQWNMYTGIPEYDAKQGGAFLSFSTKNFEVGTANETAGYIPVLFNYEKTSDGTVIEGVARDGKVVYIGIQTATISSVTQFKRLAPLTSQDTLTLRYPQVTSPANPTVDDNHKSMLYKLLGQVFGIGAIYGESGLTFDYICDPDIISIYQFEISDITNEAISYARAKAPFRGTSSGEGVIGFKSITLENK